jgi:hypothetical protein
MTPLIVPALVCLLVVLVVLHLWTEWWSNPFASWRELAILIGMGGISLAGFVIAGAAAVLEMWSAR